MILRLILFLFGGILISLGDRVQLAYGLLTQDDTSFFGQAWWVIPTFGLVSVALYDGFRLTRHLTKEAPREATLKSCALACVLFLAAYASTGPLDAWGPWLAVLLTALWIPRVIARRSRAALLFSILLALLGPLGEIAQVNTGRFAYDHPDLGQVPSWLFAIYLHGALAVHELESYLSARSAASPAKA